MASGQWEKDKTFRLQLVDKLSQLITAGFGLVAALAWNEAIQGLFARFQNERNTLTAKFLYAVVVTVVIVAITVQLGRIANRLNHKP